MIIRDAVLDDVRRFLRYSRSFDVDGMADEQLRRRIAAFAIRFQQPTGPELITALRRDARTRERFVEALTINVTRFFRNADAWERLRADYLRPLGTPLRAWSAGCSRGAEPYSLSLLAREASLDAEIVATDVDPTVLSAARERTFDDRDVEEVSPGILRRYMHRVGGRWMLDETIGGDVEFLAHDLISQPPPDTGFDLIICRNVTIYFSDEAKHAVYSNLATATRPGGIVFLGPSERIAEASSLGFEFLEHQFYRRTA